MVAGALLLSLDARANAVIHVKCSADCGVKIDGKRGEKISEAE